MSLPKASSMPAMAERSAAAAHLLRGLAHPGRLLALCALMESGEAPAGQLQAVTGLSQSALSQHLAILREQGFVRTRRRGVSIIYSIADPKVSALIATLHGLFCDPDAKS
ncbi:MAG: ArsR family transcriptional regulator [Alphaproteobacteria bacterium]|nr:ArsR family transcriptional regulator [Alphaproteobacteria bacterium]